MAAAVDGNTGKIRSEESEVAAKHGPAAKPPAQGSPAPVRGRVTGQKPAETNGPAANESGVTPIGEITEPGRAAVEGRVRGVEIRPVERNSVLACEISDGTGDLTALFYGRSHIPGIVCGARVRLRGSAGIRADGHPVMINPAYELLFPAV